MAFSGTAVPGPHLLTLSLLVGAGMLLSLLAHVYWAWYRLRHIPGPRWAAFSKWWMLRNTLSGKMHLALKRACDEYGPVVRIGPNDLVTNDSEILRRMWAVRSPYRKGDFYDAIRLDPTKDNIISMRDDHAHNELRAKVAIGYSGKENEFLETAIDVQMLSLVRLIEERYLSTSGVFRPMDFASKMQYLTLDIITSLAFGECFGYLSQDKDVHNYIQITEESMPVMMTLSVLPSLAAIMQSPFFRRAMPSEHDRVGLGKFIAVAKKVLAGSDTTATAMRMTMVYLMTTPTAYNALAKEVRDACDRSLLSVPVQDAEARRLPYLQATIREGLRVFPPVTGLMSVAVPRGGDVMHGMSIPEGTQIGWSAFGVLRSKAVFGPDADTFRPERWLEAGDEELKAMTAQWELVFKYGKWQCLGKTVALLDLNKIFVELLRRFDFSLIDPIEPMKSYSAGIFIQSNLMVKVVGRGP
ncbi:benzoate 4-monooxygenase cytochrome P450 [Verticillium alfalfae VaMs.102]|uniref:Benzoate 4-monooxygenase cytochrome P450 n=1 Tax=Verticillium alfalfae (strain VaMs.102 / ATCC MYA-4576 / FGSC 10136) TaxID=526221 RepID=C9S7A5_VERA1|nr:benzoate 4-monooxygenase cytochrome P450 [Verticillium alfalfae VaMs.102]EEY14690.1 benzoate 4-monooxygenase cytochrome P450 [Verticillium alfalfae VaMs.102]